MACRSYCISIALLSIIVHVAAHAQKSADTLLTVAGADTIEVVSTASGTIHSVSSQQIARFPFRGLQNYLALFPGVVQQDGSLYVRGSRRNDLGYALNGTSVTNRFTGLEGVQVIPEAMQRIELHPGIGSNVDGFANGGIVYTTMKTGGDELSLSAQYLTDDFARPGREFLGTSAYGFRTAVLTAEGPMPWIDAMKFFIAGEHRYMRNRRPMWLTPFSFQLQTEQTPSNPVPVDLPGPVAFPQNYVPNSWIESNTVQGTLTFDWHPVAFQFTGSYQKESRTQGGEWPSALVRIFNQKRTPTRENGTTFLQLRAEHKVTDDLSYDITIGYQRYSSETLDPDFGSDWQSYTDSLKNARKGYGGFTSYWEGPRPYSVISGFDINHPDAPNNAYTRSSQHAWTLAANATHSPLKNVTFNAGGELELWTMRYFNVADIRTAMAQLRGYLGNSPYQFQSTEERRILLAKWGRINHYGYDVDGNVADDGFDAPRTPVFASAHGSGVFSYGDIIMHLGLRVEHYRIKQKSLTSPTWDDINPRYEVLEESKLEEMKTSTLILPRLALSSLISPSTVLFASASETAQLPPLSLIYAGNTHLSRTVATPYFFTRLAYTETLKPERTTHFELGLRQKLPHGLEMHGTLILKSMRDMLTYARSESDGGGFAVWRNNGESSIKGFELSLSLARRSGFAAQLHYTLSSAQGTESTPHSSIGRVELRILENGLLTPLDFHQTHKATFLLDYVVREETHPILDGLGVNLILIYNSGHSFTRMQPVEFFGSGSPWNIGVVELIDPRSAYPAEPINNSTTPPTFNIDLRIQKSFRTGGLDLTVFANVLNLLNTKHVLNVYSRTGNAADDGWLTNRLAAFYQTPPYDSFYRAINLQNRWAYMSASGNDIYGTPRQIRVGVNVSY